MNGKARVRLFTFSVILLLMGTALVGAFFRPATSIKAAPPSGLHVVGNHIQDSTGRIIVPHGVNRMGTEYQCTKSAIGTNFDGPIDQASVNAMLTWGINIVRVPLNEDCWLGINGFPASGFSAAQYQQQIMSWVNLLIQNNMIVIVEMHWNAPGSTQATGQEPMPDMDHAPAFWTSVANTFKANSSIIFDIYNEPFTTSWSCWKNGSTAASASPCTDVPFAAAGMQTLVNTVRATGATNVVMLGGLAFSNDVSQWLANKPTDSLNNLVASVHIYNFNACANTGCWDSQIAPVVAQVPVMIGELGENDCASGFINTLMTWLDQHTTGYLAWTWTVTGNCGGTPSLLNDYSGNPTGYGAGYRTHLMSLATMTPTPNPTPTATPTRGVTPTPTMGVTPTPTRGVTPTPTTGVTPTPTTGTPASCRVTYTITSQWPGNFGASFAITNTGTTAINGWNLTFTFANGQTITQLWNGTFVQSGANITVTNLSYNAALAPGATMVSPPGFNGTQTGTNAVPTSFKLNGATCS